MNTRGYDPEEFTNLADDPKCLHIKKFFDYQMSQLARNPFSKGKQNRTSVWKCPGDLLEALRIEEYDLQELQ